MTTLEDLYYGNISPHERYTKRGSRADLLVKLICKNEESLTAGLTEQQKETFEKFKDGFILAVRIMVEAMEGLEAIEDA